MGRHEGERRQWARGRHTDTRTGPREVTVGPGREPLSSGSSSLSEPALCTRRQASRSAG